MLAMMFFVSGHTTLGDNQAYLEGGFSHRNSWASGAYMLSVIGDITRKAFGSMAPFVANGLALIMSLIGVLLSVKMLGSRAKGRLGLLLFACTPACSMWCVIHGKEAAVVLALGLVSIGWVSQLKQGAVKPIKSVILGYAVLWYFKPPLAIAALIAHLALCIYSLPSRKGGTRAALLALLWICGAGFLYAFSDFIYEGADGLYAHFSAGRSTRQVHLWGDKMEFYSRFPALAITSFIGPTFDEARSDPKKLLLFIEGVVIFCVLIWLTLRPVLFRKGTLLCLCVNLTILLGFISAHLPYGLWNPGSAVRYRTGFVFHLTFVLFVMSFRVFSTRDVRVASNSKEKGR